MTYGDGPKGGGRCNHVDDRFERVRIERNRTRHPPRDEFQAHHAESDDDGPCSETPYPLFCQYYSTFGRFLRGSFATTFSIMRIPASWPSVMIDSGWNCTAATGSLLCSKAMMTPSSVSAVTRNSSGNRAGSAKIEW